MVGFIVVCWMLWDCERPAKKFMSSALSRGQRSHDLLSGLAGVLFAGVRVLFESIKSIRARVELSRAGREGQQKFPHANSNENQLRRVLVAFFVGGKGHSDCKQVFFPIPPSFFLMAGKSLEVKV